MSKVTEMGKISEDVINVLSAHGFALQDISKQNYLIIADHEGFNNSCLIAEDEVEVGAFIEELVKEKSEPK